MYLTKISIDGHPDWLKPGMTAKVEIMVDRLENALYVPIQAVSAWEGKQVCYLVRGSERKQVEIGQFNDEFIEIKKGLNEGDLVSLRSPSNTAQEEGGSKSAKPAESPAKPAGS
jgi:multidrug efflux pump subunit AcrA (membrane-fusion protein)